VLSVTDHGPGIAPADQPHVFERFFRADTETQTAGLGLGLAVVREFAETMAGTISPTSTPAKTTSTLRIPRSSPYRG
jgi:signal transduction histidine kinase